MAEKRYHDFGRVIQAEDQNALQSFMFGAGVLTGNDLSISSDASRLEIAAGAVITGDGVVISNDNHREIALTPQADATIFTIVQYHDFDLQAGGRGSTYAMEEIEDGGSPSFGVRSDLSSEGVVLGWCRYPGGSVAFSDSMLFAAPKLGAQTNLSGGSADPLSEQMNPLRRFAPYVTGDGVLLTLDTDVSAAHAVASGVLRTTISNGHAAATRTANNLYLSPSRDALYRPKYVKLRGLSTSHVDVSLTVNIIVNGVTTALGTITGSVLSDSEQTLLIPDSVFSGAPVATGDDWLVHITASLPALQNLSLEEVRAFAGPLPYTA